MKNKGFIKIFVILVVCATFLRAEPVTKEQLSHYKVKVAAVQMNGNWNWHGDKFRPDSGEKVAYYIEKAASDGADLVVFPELLLGMFKVPCETTDNISELAAKYKINVIAGCFEIRDDQGRYSNSMLIFDRNGKIIGRYFKMHAALGESPFLWPPMPKDPEWMMVDGDELPVFDLDFGRIGLFTCYDGLFPEGARILSLKGAEILIWANARGGSVEDYIVRTYMAQNYVHMITTNKAVGAGTMIAQWPDNIKEITTEPGEQYICTELEMPRLRLARKYSREFMQRAPEKYTEITKRYPVWENYTGVEDVADVPSPASLYAIEKSVTTPGKIDLKPVINHELKKRTDKCKEGEDLYRLSFEMAAPWFEGSVELRLPEILHSNMGFHYLDHYLSNLSPLSELEPFPNWRKNDQTGQLRYDAVTKEGISFGAVVTPGYDEVALEFYIQNNTGDTLDYVTFNPCLNFNGNPDYGRKFDLERLYAFYQGKFQNLSSMTPTPEQVGREPWLVILTKTGENEFEGPKDTKTTWWRVDQTAEENLMAVVSENGKTMIGYAWDQEDLHLMTNCGNPCLHTGPGARKDLNDGERYTWHGKVYLMRNNLERLLEKYRHDKQLWNSKKQ
ncbi:MAG: carbon-nitrogen hydrolase family protein [Sedimentisphaeraceae bacterium JB056]